MNGTILKYVKAGGLIAITALLVAVIWQVITGYQDTINNHIEHSTDAWVDVKSVLVELKGSIEANTNQTGRLEEVIRDLR